MSSGPAGDGSIVSIGINEDGSITISKEDQDQPSDNGSTNTALNSGVIGDTIEANSLLYYNMIYYHRYLHE
mgnify:CR=1 FL=1